MTNRDPLPKSSILVNRRDNSKKFVEIEGVYGGPGKEVHKACVIGDTVGDPFKVSISSASSTPWMGGYGKRINSLCMHREQIYILTLASSQHCCPLPLFATGHERAGPQHPHQAHVDHLVDDRPGAVAAPRRLGDVAVGLGAPVGPAGFIRRSDPDAVAGGDSSRGGQCQRVERR